MNNRNFVMINNTIINDSFSDEKSAVFNGFLSNIIKIQNTKFFSNDAPTKKSLCTIINLIAGNQVFILDSLFLKNSGRYSGIIYAFYMNKIIISGCNFDQNIGRAVSIIYLDDSNNLR